MIVIGMDFSEYQSFTKYTTMHCTVVLTFFLDKNGVIISSISKIPFSQPPRTHCPINGLRKESQILRGKNDWTATQESKFPFVDFVPNILFFNFLIDKEKRLTANLLLYGKSFRSRGLERKMKYQLTQLISPGEEQINKQAKYHPYVVDICYIQLHFKFHTNPSNSQAYRSRER